MNFLANVLADLAVKVLEFLYGKISKYLTKALELKRGYEAARHKNAKVRERVENAQTKEERIDALKEDIRSFND